MGTIRMNTDIIRQFYMGRVVIDHTINDVLPGHVVGFSTNHHGEVVIKVEWADGDRYAVLPSDLTAL
jgi:hypothetical protein